ncbi:hypothetical protein ACFSTE_17415 [Aquimarina hainanensis]|uniref:Uncharacterized protein n=1 Tax=Aquimarina hainanensis TaxID=1578017 RepID=A0ABW5NBA8_9FLAO|nr:hypothetical protein [Aquimarina sp. TRL1]QKX06883.1 hypothetical protein HN014_18820 [Aquimarina sp. TRL1]
MVTFLLILAGLVVLNFVLLKFSVHSVDAGKKNKKNLKEVRSTASDKESISEAA